MFNQNYKENLKVALFLDEEYKLKFDELTFLLPKSVIKNSQDYDEFSFENSYVFANQETNENFVKLFVDIKNSQTFSISIKNTNFNNFLNSKYKLVLDFATLVYKENNTIVKQTISLLNKGDELEIIKEKDTFDIETKQQISAQKYKRHNVPKEDVNNFIKEQFNRLI